MSLAGTKPGHSFRSPFFFSLFPLGAGTYSSSASLPQRLSGSLWEIESEREPTTVPSVYVASAAAFRMAYSPTSDCGQKAEQTRAQANPGILLLLQEQLQH